MELMARFRSFRANFWLPEEGATRAPRSERDRVPTNVWKARGWLDPDAGNVIGVTTTSRRAHQAARVDLSSRLRRGYDPIKRDLSGHPKLRSRNGLDYSPVRQALSVVMPRPKELGRG